MIGSHIAHLMQEHKGNPCIMDLCETIVRMEAERDKAEGEARQWQALVEYRLEEIVRIHTHV